MVLHFWSALLCDFPVWKRCRYVEMEERVLFDSGAISKAGARERTIFM